MEIRSKKSLGQHFLKDESIARDITRALTADPERITPVLELGPGTGVLSKYLLENPSIELFAIEIDQEAVNYLQRHYPSLSPRLLHGDFLAMQRFPAPFALPERFKLIGNFPYNISSPIFFKVIAWRDRIPEVVCMVQKEVACRLTAREGSRIYGILSVLLQTWYHIEYLFTVPPQAFLPPPKVLSAVIKLTRNARSSIPCDEAFYKKVVKTVFNQRRKTLRNTLKPFLVEHPRAVHPFFPLRPEQLSVEQFLELARWLSLLSPPSDNFSVR